MGRNINSILTYSSSDYTQNTFSVPAGSSRSVDIDLVDCADAKVMLEVTYAATHASTTGCTVASYYGMGPASAAATGPVPCVLQAADSSAVPTGVVMSDNSDSVTMTSFTTGSATSQTKRTFAIISDPLTRTPRWLRLKFTNTDVTNAATVRIYIET